MYVKLGSTKINYKTGNSDDFIIFAQVVDSQLGFEKPVIVRTKEELDIWFGKEFSDRDYLLELLDLGMSLYLHKPVNSEPNKEGIKDFVNFKEYSKYGKELSYTELTDPSFNKSEKVLYSVRLDGDVVKDFYWDETIGDFFAVEDHPQNFIPNNTSSQNNRDTITIYEYIENKEKKYLYLSPTFITSYINPEESNNINIDIDLGYGKFREIPLDEQYIKNIEKLDCDRLSNNLQTLQYNLLFNKEILFETIDKELNYIVKDNVIHVFCSKSERDLSEKLIKELSDLKNATNLIDVEYHEYINKENGEETIIKDVFSSSKITLSSIENIKHFYNISGFLMEPDFNYTNDYINNYLKTNNYYKEKISFVSKTIGTGDIDGNIEIKITKPTDDIYRIEISRFEYSELFEGSILGTTEYQSLEDLINNYSKLVYCKIHNSQDKEADLPQGMWALRGGKEEVLNSDSYVKSLELLSNPTDTLYFDYLLIPDINRFPIEEDLIGGYYKIYKDLVNLSKEIGCQVLIQNSPGELKTDTDYVIVFPDDIESLFGEGEVLEENEIGLKINIGDMYGYDSPELKSNNPSDYVIGANLVLRGISRFSNDNIGYYIYPGNYIFNYTEDKDNRLIYFYDSIEVGGIKKPGYYLYLTGLFNNNYSYTTNTIQYQTPLTECYASLFDQNTYNGNNSNLIKVELDLIKSLENKKCNYLLSNSREYYYEKYQNGNNYTTTGWMRFCIEKIKRELIKNKWQILDNKSYKDIEININNILERIKNRFSIVKDIVLADLEISYKDKKIDIKIDSFVSDLVNNNIRIDVTLNYNL